MKGMTPRFAKFREPPVYGGARLVHFSVQLEMDIFWQVIKKCLPTAKVEESKKILERTHRAHSDKNAKNEFTIGKSEFTSSGCKHVFIK